MSKQVWTIATFLSLVAVLGLACFTAWQRGTELQSLRAQVAEVQTAMERLALEGDRLKEQVTEKEGRVVELERQNQETTKAQKDLEQEMRAALESKDVTISKLQGKLTVNILDRVLFDSGEAVVKTEGEKVLEQVAGILKQHPELQIHVIGHTDNVPIRTGGRGRFASNWELSTARATAALRFLTERCSVDPRRVGAVGYGEFRPLADNGTVEGRARNRRIAIVVLADELVGADVPSAPQSEKGMRLPDEAGVSTNAPASGVTNSE